MSALEKLREAQADFVAGVRARGGEVVSYTPPCGCEPIERTRPPRGQTWDTLATCPSCGSLHFLVMTHDSFRAKAVQS